MKQTKIFVVAGNNRNYLDWLAVNELPRKLFSRFSKPEDVIGTEGAAYVVIYGNEHNEFYNSVPFGMTVERRRMIKIQLELGHTFPKQMRDSFIEHGFYLTDPTSKL